MWTQFMDMHSGGGTKEAPYEYIYIEAPRDEAEVIFYNRFGHSPSRVTCTCCGEDYSVTQSKTLEEATGYERGCLFSKDKDVNTWVDIPDSGYRGQRYMPLGVYKELPSVLIIEAKDIKDSEKTGDIPQQGYLWVD